MDYKSIEPRLTAYYMSRSIGDDTLTEEFKEGIDPYVTLSQDIEIIRQDAKTLFLSQLYGGGIPTIKNQLGLSEQEAKTLRNNFNKARPGIKKLRDAVAQRRKQRGYITTLWGRELHPEEEYKSLNYLIQGCAADLIRWAMRQVHDWTVIRGLESHLVSNIHDELKLDAVEKEIKLLVAEVPGLMKYPQIEEIVPIEVDVEYTTTNWGEKKEWQK